VAGGGVGFAGDVNDNRALIDLDAIPRVFDHLVAPATELIALGLTGRAIHDRCREGGPWQRLESGLVLLSNQPPNRTQRIHAALTVAGQDAVLTGVDALALHGMTAGGLDGPVHLLVASRRQPRLVDGVLFERTHQLPEPLHLAGFPVAPLPRATIDTCRRAKAAEHVRTVLTESITRGLLTPTTLRDELDRAGSRGTALPRRVLAEIDDKVRLVAQGWAKRLVQQLNLPAPTWRVPIASANGSYVATADAWWDDVAMAWEVDSYAFDLSPADAAATLRRAARLTACGVIVLHTPPAQLRDERDTVVDLLRSAYHQATARPRPNVRARD
jgi:hypothetical protein